MRRLLTPPWLVLHFFAVVLTTGFILLGWWQLGRAQGGNAVSWGYAFQWPVFALFTVVVWIRQMRLELRGDRTDTERPKGRPEPPPMSSPFEPEILRARRTEPERAPLAGPLSTEPNQGSTA